MSAVKKNIGAPVAPGEIPGHSINHPLFEEEGLLSLEQQGGLVVLDTGQIAEVVPPVFVPEGGDQSPSGRRLQPLPFDLVKEESGEVSIKWRPLAYDPTQVTVGLELEYPTMTQNGRWHHISPDGKNIVYPDGTTEPAELRGHDPEALKNTTECGSPVEDLPQGYEDFRWKALALKVERRAWLKEHGLVAPPISAYPEVIRTDDVNTHPYLRMYRERGLVPLYNEYSPALSEQLNIQWKSPEAAAFAVNAYQSFQAVFGLITAASPARDGSVFTTLREHYEHGFAEVKNPRDYNNLASLVRRELAPFYDQAPDDWREFCRAYGSPSGGVQAIPAPLDAESFLREGDHQLRGNRTMTIGRTLGWHADRLRPDKGVIEVSNLSHGGDNPEKMSAAEEAVIKTIVALQEYFADPSNFKKAWEGVIPAPNQLTDLKSRDQFLHVGRVNNMIASLFGKNRNLFDNQWQEIAPQEILDKVIDFVASYCPEPISEDAIEELYATLEQSPHARMFGDADEVFAYFYSPRSHMTAAEALRTAQAVEPDVALSSLLLKMSEQADVANGRYLEKACGGLALGLN